MINVNINDDSAALSVAGDIATVQGDGYRLQVVKGGGGHPVQFNLDLEPALLAGLLPESAPSRHRLPINH